MFWLLVRGVFLVRFSQAPRSSVLDDRQGFGLTIAPLILVLILFSWRLAGSYLTIGFVLLIEVFASPVAMRELLSVPLNLLPWLGEWVLLSLFVWGCLDAVLLQMLFGRPLRVRVQCADAQTVSRGSRLVAEP
jgi:hypothetical protein